MMNPARHFAPADGGVPANDNPAGPAPLAEAAWLDVALTHLEVALASREEPAAWLLAVERAAAHVCRLCTGRGAAASDYKRKWGAVALLMDGHVRAKVKAEEIQSDEAYTIAESLLDAAGAVLDARAYTPAPPPCADREIRYSTVDGSVMYYATGPDAIRAFRARMEASGWWDAAGRWADAVYDEMFRLRQTISAGRGTEADAWEACRLWCLAVSRAEDRLLDDDRPDQESTAALRNLRQTATNILWFALVERKFH
jgi:hypothetical protein